MTLDECAKVLTKIQLGDNRQVDRLVLAEWFDSIGHLNFEDAIQAVTMHRRASTEYLQPAHVVTNAKRIADDRVMRRADELPAGVFPPQPKNMEALSAAWNDPEAWAREIAVYDQQLLDAGFEATK